MSTRGNRPSWLIATSLFATFGVFAAMPLLQNRPAQDTLTLGMPVMKPIREFDPLRIAIAWEATVLHNLFTPLLLLDNPGQYTPGVAESWNWDGRTVSFKIRPGLRTVDGHKIDAHDAAFTLRRAIFASTNHHGDLASFLCTEEELKSRICSTIEVADALTLRLTVLREELAPHLINALGNMDFGIIPESSTQGESWQTSRIVDYRNTSGPYYVEKDAPDGSFVLAANPNHFIHTSETPKRIVFKALGHNEWIPQLTSGAIDALNFLTADVSKEFIPLFSNPEIGAYETLPIKKFIIAVNPEFREKHSQKETLAVLAHIRTHIQEQIQDSRWKASFEFFPRSGNGQLRAEDASAVEHLYQQGLSIPADQLPSFTIGSLANRREIAEAVSKNLPTSRYKELPKLNFTLPASEKTDFFICLTDSGFYEDVALLSFYLTTDHFPMNRQEGIAWLAAYLRIPKKDTRLEEMRKLHLRTLTEGSMAVAAEAPYVTLTRKPWRYDGSPYYAGAPLWTFRRN